MVSPEVVIRSIRFAGLPNVIRAARYAQFKSRLNQLHPSRQIGTLTARSTGHLLEKQDLPGGGVFHFENASLEVLFLAPDLVRISWSPGIPPLPYALTEREWISPEPILTNEGNKWVLKSNTMQVWVCPDGSLSFKNAGGRAINQQLPPVSCSGKEVEVSWTAVSILQPEEHLVGLGEHSGYFNLVGQIHRFWNSSPGGKYGPGQDPLYAPIPVYLGLHPRGSYLVFFENPFAGFFRAGPGILGTEGEIEFSPGIGLEETGTPRFSQISFEGGMLRYYLILGAPDQLLERYTELTGRPELPPRWSLGYHQSRWGYKTEEEIRSVVAGFQEHELPLSAVHLDIDYMDGYRVFSVDRQRFPDLPGLSKDLHDQGVKLVTILDPGVKVDSNYALYRQGSKAGMFCTLPGGRPLVGLVWPGNTAFPDFTNPQARQWWGEQYSGLLAAGVDGFWHDMNEPEAFSASGDMTLPLAACHSLEGRGGDHHQAHNLYGLLMNRAGYTGLKRLKPERRPWIISRSGWAGSPRYAWNWTGDVESTWAGLRLTISMVLNLGLSGQPFSGADIGGFSGDPDAELYLRWFQAAAFLPFFRTHSAVGTDRREPWVYGEPYTTSIRKALRLRFQLLPYFYTLAWESAERGYPLIRPLFWADTRDKRLWDVEDAFLVGDALLVAPVLGPGIARRSLTLPGGAWYDFREEQVYSGPGEVSLPVSLDRIPVLVRAGAVLPLEDKGILNLHIYSPITPGQYTSRLYLDAGDGYPQFSRDLRLDQLTIKSTEDGLELDWESTGGYPLPYQGVRVYLHGKSARRAWVDGHENHPQNGVLDTFEFRILQFES